MKAKLHYVFSFAMLLLVFSVYGQESSWKKVKSIQHNPLVSKLNIEEAKANYFRLDLNTFKQELALASREKNTKTIIKIPGENGELEAFEVTEKSVFSPELAIQYPNIKSFVGYAVDGSGARLRMSVSPEGVQTMISYVDKPRLFMQPLEKGSNQYVLYQNKDKKNKLETFKCNTLESLKSSTSKSASSKLDEGGANSQTLQKFRIAISTTGEYTAYHGGTVAGALAGINATLSRVNEIFEADMAITFELVNATQLIFTNASTDPYSNSGVGADESNSDNLNGWSLQLQNTLSSTIGNGAYDIGHLFGADGGGGSAGCIGCVCRNDNTSNDFDLNKGSAYTSPSNGIPEGDTFDIDFVIHEIGHQMGANHTWAFDTEGTGVNSEPGSGSTIMGYAGLEAENNVASNSDAYFHYHSIKQILDNVVSKSCQTTESISNRPPSANAGSNFFIPAGTPYILKGTATDADTGDVLTYCWEQTDSGRVDYMNFGPTLSNGSMNRSLPPTTSTDRYIPRLVSVLNGNITQANPGLGSDWETVSSVDRVLNWALTVRDRNPSSTSIGQSSYDTMQIQVVSGNTSNPVGPFEVTSQASQDISWTQNTTETITWNVAGTNGNGINTSNVDILLSTDGGVTFDVVLRQNTPNDGSETITVPDVAAPFCRIMVAPVGNIYYAVNTMDFSIGYEVVTTCEQEYASNQNLNIPITDGGQASHTINVPDSGMLSDVMVNVAIEHTFISDLIIELTHPNGTASSILWNENCFINSGYSDLSINFSDASGAVNCSSPTVGSYTPTNPLRVFDGLDMQGVWTIQVSDGFAGDEGQLLDWSLDFCTTTTSLITVTPPPNVDFIGLKIFPNPSSGEFTVKVGSRHAATEIITEIFDITGKRVFAKTYPFTENFVETIDLKTIASGLYMVRVNDGLRNLVEKLVVE